MNNLKELTHEQHKSAEKSLFIKKLLKQELSNWEYYVYLSNQFMAYAVLEQYASELGILSDLQEIKREENIAADLKELELEYNFEQAPIMESTFAYIKHIHKIAEDQEKLLAHIYVRHMGDLSGGQIIKRYVPGAGKYYQFKTDTTDLKEKLREKLHDGMADEARLCFKLIKDIMVELEKVLDLGKTDNSV